MGDEGKPAYSGSISTLSVLLLSIIVLAIDATVDHLERSKHVHDARRIFGDWYAVDTFMGSLEKQYSVPPCDVNQMPHASESDILTWERYEGKALPEAEVEDRDASMPTDQEVEAYKQAQDEISAERSAIEPDWGDKLYSDLEADELLELPDGGCLIGPFRSATRRFSVTIEPANLDDDDRTYVVGAMIRDRSDEWNATWMTRSTLDMRTLELFRSRTPETRRKMHQRVDDDNAARLTEVEREVWGAKGQALPDPTKIPFMARFDQLHEYLINDKARVPFIDIDVSADAYLFVLALVVSAILVVMRNRVRHALKEAEKSATEPWLLVDPSVGLESWIANGWLLGVVLAPWIVGVCALASATARVYMAGSMSSLENDMLSFGGLVAATCVGGHVALQVTAQLLRIRHLRAKQEAAAGGFEHA